MKPFKVISWDFNKQDVEYYDIMPYFIEEWRKEKKRKHKIWCKSNKMPETFEEFKEFIKDSAIYFWSRSECEILIDGFPPFNKQKKIDIYDQILANLDVITKHFMENIK